MFGLVRLARASLSVELIIVPGKCTRSDQERASRTLRSILRTGAILRRGWLRGEIRCMHEAMAGLLQERESSGGVRRWTEIGIVFALIK